MKLHLTSDWPLEKIMPYSPQITASLKKLREKFPDDGTMDSYAQDILSGSIQLWLMLDGEDFKGIVLTAIKTVEATGHKAMIIAGLEGEGALDMMDHFPTLEDYARDEKCNSIQPVGRMGWKKPLEKFGYHVDRVVYRKDLN